MMRVCSLLALAACAAPRLAGPRFHNTEPARVVDDRRDVPRPPAPRDPQLALYFFDGIVTRQLTRALELPGDQRARGTNALDEVPDSTWFTNRIGVRELTPDEIRRGPAPTTPEAHLPWSIVKMKVGGTQAGFIAKDTRGVKFLLKFDRKDLPEVETGADAITARLLWAAGYNVLAIPLAAGALAWAGISLAPAASAILMSASTVIVALNAQLLRRVRLSPVSSG